MIEEPLGLVQDVKVFKIQNIIQKHLLCVIVYVILFLRLQADLCAGRKCYLSIFFSKVQFIGIHIFIEGPLF